jgi:hypothetical protein
MRLLASRYLFPGTELREWNEGSASIELYDRVGASLAWSPHGLGTDWISRTVEGWVQQPLTRNSSVELGYGSVALARFDYWFARVGLTHRLDRFVLGLTYHWSDPELRRFGFDEKSRRLVLSISTAY